MTQEVRAPGLERLTAQEFLRKEAVYYGGCSGGILDNVPFEHVSHVCRIMADRIDAIPAALSVQEPAPSPAVVVDEAMVERKLPYPPIVIVTGEDGREHRVGVHEYRTAEREGGIITIAVFMGDHRWLEAELDPRSAKVVSDLILSKPSVAALTEASQNAGGEQPAPKPAGWQRKTALLGWVEVDSESLDHYRANGHELRAYYLDPTSAPNGVSGAVREALDGTAMRTGDHVQHAPTGETWVVAWADHATGYMAPCGWPECQAKISDCTIVKKASDSESAELVEQLTKSGRKDAHRAAALSQEPSPSAREES